MTKLKSSERGATGVEYALLGSLIAAVVSIAVAGLGQKLIILFTSVAW